MGKGLSGRRLPAASPVRSRRDALDQTKITGIPLQIAPLFRVEYVDTVGLPAKAYILDMRSGRYGEIQCVDESIAQRIDALSGGACGCEAPCDHAALALAIGPSLAAQDGPNTNAHGLRYSLLNEHPFAEARVQGAGCRAILRCLRVTKTLMWADLIIEDPPGMPVIQQRARIESGSCIRCGTASCLHASVARPFDPPTVTQAFGTALWRTASQFVTVGRRKRSSAEVEVTFPSGDRARAYLARTGPRAHRLTLDVSGSGGEHLTVLAADLDEAEPSFTRRASLAGRIRPCAAHTSAPSLCEEWSVASTMLRWLDEERSAQRRKRARAARERDFAEWLARWRSSGSAAGPKV